MKSEKPVGKGNQVIIVKGRTLFVCKKITYFALQLQVRGIREHRLNLSTVPVYHFIRRITNRICMVTEVYYRHTHTHR